MAVKVSIGKLDRKVTLRAPVTAQNDEGGVGTTYPTDTLTLFAYVRDSTYQTGQGRSEEANQTVMVNTKDIYVRWAESRANIDHTWQAEYEGKIYTVQNVSRVEQGWDFLKIVVRGK
jgi:SPP1 family predicted phage head-tail adaptor